MVDVPAFGAEFGNLHPGESVRGVGWSFETYLEHVLFYPPDLVTKISP
jgi:hypothetical protein